MPDIRAELVAAAKRRASLRARLTVADRELHALIVRGRAEGLSVSEMCRIAGLSRERAHKALRRAAAGGE